MELGSSSWKRMSMQLTGKRDDNPLHSAARTGEIGVITEIIANTQGEKELLEKVLKQNQAGETPLFIAVEYGYVDLVRELVKYYDLEAASIKAKNGFDAFHIAAKQGDLEIMKVLMETHPELTMTVDMSNTTALHTAANQGHVEVVNYLLQTESNLANISKSNGKTALHSAARNGHVEVIKALLSNDTNIATRTDKKGQTALHMAVKGQNIEIIEEFLKADTSPINVADTKGNTPLHIATRKGRAQIVKLLLGQSETNLNAINQSNETAIDIAEKIGQAEVKAILRKHGVRSARSLKPQNDGPARELKQTVSDIKHEVHDQLQHTRQTRRQVEGITRRLRKLHAGGLTNAINSTTIVAVLIATVAFTGLFQVPGQWNDNKDHVRPGFALGEANIGDQPAFVIFFVFDATALFVSLGVVVVQISVVVIENKMKRQLVAVISKIMWIACVLISIAFLAMSFVVVGEDQRWLAIAVTIIGSIIMAGTLSTMCYWVILHRIEALKLLNTRMNSLNGQPEPIHTELKHIYAL